MALPSRPGQNNNQAANNSPVSDKQDVAKVAVDGIAPKLPVQRPQRPTELPNLAEIDARSNYLEDEGLVPEMEANPAALRTFDKNSSPLNLQGYTNIGRLTSQDLFDKDFETHFATLQDKVLTAKTDMQNLLQEQNLVDQIGEARSNRGIKYDEMRQVLDQFLTRYYSTQFTIRRQDIPTVSALVVNEILGLGPIEPLWLDPDITEIMVNGPHHVYVEIKGKLYFVPGAQFRNTQHLLEVAQQILGPINKTIDVANPLEDGRLVDGSRVNITHPSVGPGGPFMTIRRFPDTAFTLRTLVKFGSMTEEMATEIGNLVHAGYSTVISGGTGTGKTSALNAFSGCIPRDERIITIEDTLELQMHPEAHVVSMEARRSHQNEGRGSVSIRDLVRNALRQRPDRIVVGEVRDASAYDMLQAMNTGHDGSLTTVHANDAHGAIDRLTNLMMESGDIVEARALSLIAGGVDIMVINDRFPEDGSRRVVAIDEIPNRISTKDGELSLEPRRLYEFRQTDLIKDETGRNRVIGEYVKVNDQSEDLIRKHRYDRRVHLSLDELYKLSDRLEKPIEASKN